MTATDDDDFIDELIERRIDEMDATGDRLWRHKTTGMTKAQAIAQATQSRRKVVLSAPVDEYRLLAQMAGREGCSVTAFVRRCVATTLADRYRVPPTAMRWLAGDGLWP